MEITQLRVFLSVAAFGSFTAAARQLHMTQPSVSQNIKMLETACGTQLFNRSSKTVQLTPSGESLVPYAQAAIKAIDDGYRATLAARPTTTLRIGVVTSYFDQLIPPVAKELHASHPESVLSVHTARTQELYKSITAGNLDLAFVCGRIASEHLAFLPVMDEPLALVQNAASPWLPRRISMRELSHVPFIQFSRAIGYHRLIGRRLQRSSCSPRVVAELDTCNAICSMVAKGLGVAFVPVSCLYPEQWGGSDAATSQVAAPRRATELQVVEITDAKPMRHQIMLAYRHDRLSNAGRHFLSLAAKRFPILGYGA